MNLLEGWCLVDDRSRPEGAAFMRITEYRSVYFANIEGEIIGISHYYRADSSHHLCTRITAFSGDNVKQIRPIEFEILKLRKQLVDAGVGFYNPFSIGQNRFKILVAKHLEPLITEDHLNTAKKIEKMMATTLITQ